MNDSPVNGSDPDELTRRNWQRRQVWLVLIIMLASGCAGALVILGLVLLFRNYLPAFL
jgi:hypothetical protein